MTLNQPTLKAPNTCSNSSNATYCNISKVWCHFHRSCLAHWAERDDKPEWPGKRFSKLPTISNWAEGYQAQTLCYYKKWSLRSSPLASSDPAATIFLRRPSHFLIPLLCYYILEAFYFKRITAIGLLYFPLRFLRQKYIGTIVTQYTESTVYWPGWWIFAHTAQHIPGFSYQFSDRDQGRQKP